MLNAQTDVLEARAIERLAGFCRFLHANGFGIGAGASGEVLDVASRVGVLEGPLLRASLQALLCGRCEEWRRFEALFDAWFLPPNRWSRPEVREREAGVGAIEGEPGAGRGGEDRNTPSQRRTASRQELPARTDLRELLQREHQLDIEALVRRIAQRLKHLQLRRQARALHGRRLDLRATIRRSISSGGTPFHLAWQHRRRVRPRLVLLLDVSRSMAAYSFFYLRLARALSAELADVHSFIFHTRVTAVSDALRDADPWRAQERLQLLAQGWGGGTRIGESLAQFQREHAPRVVHGRTVLFVLSDGYDTGDPSVLAEALARLRRRARRIVWLNPLCSHAGEAPPTRAMQAALPHLDLLAPGADLASVGRVLTRFVEGL